MPRLDYHATEYQQYIYYKGVRASSVNRIRAEGYIQPKTVNKAGEVIRGVYVTKSENTAARYGDYILKLDLKGKNVVKSPHSNQFICLGAIEANRIINVAEVVR